MDCPGRIIYTAQDQLNTEHSLETKGSTDHEERTSTPVLVDGLLFGFSNGGDLFCINAKDGKLAWKTAAGPTGRRGGGFASIVAAGSVMLALPNSSELIVFKPTARAFEQAAKIKVAESATYAYPVVAKSGIFVKDQDSLALLAVE